jgi:hypothetical protein
MVALVAKNNATATKILHDDAASSENALVDLHSVEKMHMANFENATLHIKSEHNRLHSEAFQIFRSPVLLAKQQAINLTQVASDPSHRSNDLNSR